MTIFYISSDYVRGILPAKFFECLATAKPVMVSGLEEARPYADAVYDIEGDANRAIELIADLPRQETEERQARRRQIARQSDWANRFEEFAAKVLGT